MCERLRSHGGKATIVSLTGGPSDDALVRSADTFTWLNEVSPGWRTLRTIAELRAVLIDSKPDIVHLHGARPILVGSIAARLAGCCGIVASLHGSTDLMAMRSDGTVGTLGVAFARLVHGIGFALSRRVVVCAEALVPEVRRSMRLLGCFGYRRSSSNVSVVHHGIDLAPLQASKTKRRRFVGGAVTIGVLSRLDEPKKGISYLLRAKSILEKNGIDAALKVGGSGYSRAQLEAEARALCLKDCEFLGHVSNPAEFYQSLDIFVLPSLSEGMPLVNLEAMASGAVVVTTNVGGAAEAVLNEACGLVVPPADASSLAAAIERLCRNPEWAIKLTLAGERRVRDYFTAEATFLKLDFVYRLALDNR
jgi:glycosyltransferase involved in cell wall biosynthesis